MKIRYRFVRLTFISVVLLLTACGSDQTVNPPNNNDLTLDDLEFGTDNTLDIITWNVESFPKADNNTVQYMTEIITNLEADIICLQEIVNAQAFTSLSALLPGWKGFKANSAAYDIDLALFYKSDSLFQFVSVQELFPDDWWAFPRPPLLLTIDWNEERYYIINNHLKASGGDENIQRRRAACDSLYNYVQQNLSTQNVIIAGDLNDTLIDLPAENVFQIFLDDPQNFLFTDYEIATGPSAYWSFGNGASHLDHIIISSALFDEFNSTQSDIQTVCIDEYLNGGWSEYDQYISDHRPVALKIPLF